MALYKEIISWKKSDEIGYYHKIRSINIIAIQTKDTSILGELTSKYAVTIKVGSYLSKEKAAIDMEGMELFSKQYSVTVTALELAAGGLIGLLYKALKEQDDFKDAQDV